MHNHLHMRTAEFEDAKCMSHMPCRLIYDSQTNSSDRHFRDFTTVTLTYPFPLSSAPFPRIEARRIRGCPQPNVHEFPTSNPRLRWKFEIAVCNLSQSDVEGSLDGWDTFNRRQHTKVTMGCWAQWRRICRPGIRVVYTTSRTNWKQLPNIDNRTAVLKFTHSFPPSQQYTVRYMFTSRTYLFILYLRRVTENIIAM